MRFFINILNPLLNRKNMISYKNLDLDYSVLSEGLLWRILNIYLFFPESQRIA